MIEELNPRKPMRIVAAMKKPACFLLFLLFTVPAVAQQTGAQFGFMIGGSERLYTHSDKATRDQFCKDNPNLPCPSLPGSNIRLGDRDFEMFFAVELEPATQFKIRAGQINTDVGGNLESSTDFALPTKGHIEHADGIVQYNIAEPFGRTGIFAGFGMYRTGGNNIASETNYGYTFGVAGDFPITRRYGFVAEGSYYWINNDHPIRLITVTGGLRVNF